MFKKGLIALVMGAFLLSGQSVAFANEEAEETNTEEVPVIDTTLLVVSKDDVVKFNTDPAPTGG
ncbi:hypothetical protein [Cytobacillus sp. IB215665]|uniref:hypothetical protein n=1 Tax=Cytobacillus sp. IB215665 TaxID=3097357 RepID=UPI002A14E8A1|nr:hypothetical protein [Cytobacillus sp. IB215665]MDX8367821.1 hypothetical protein [Cytobacillus sp. IB215665]